MLSLLYILLQGVQVNHWLTPIAAGIGVAVAGIVASFKPAEGWKAWSEAKQAQMQADSIKATELAKHKITQDSKGEEIRITLEKKFEEQRTSYERIIKEKDLKHAQEMEEVKTRLGEELKESSTKINEESTRVSQLTMGMELLLAFVENNFKEGTGESSAITKIRQIVLGQT